MKKQSVNRPGALPAILCRTKPYDMLIRLLRLAFFGARYILVGFLFARARFFFSVSPLAISLLAAAGGHTLYYAGGALAATLLGGDTAGTAALLLTLLLRLSFWQIFTKHPPLSYRRVLHFSAEEMQNLFAESLSLRLSAGAVGGFAAGALQTVLGGFLPGDLYGLLLYIFLCPLFTYLFYAAKNAEKPLPKRFGQTAFCILCVYAVSAYSLFGFSFAYALAAAFAYTAAKTERPAVAALFGGLLLLPLSPVPAAALSLFSLTAAVLYPRAPLYAVCGGSIAFAALAFLLGGSRVFAAAFPEILIGGGLSAYLSYRKGRQSTPAAAVEKEKDGVPAFLLAEAAAKEKQDLLALADGFAETANTFFFLSDRAARAEMLDTRAICERAFDRLCRRCPAAKVCFGRAGTRAADALTKAGEALAGRGQVRTEDFPAEFAAFCPHKDEIAEEIELENADALRRRLGDYGEFTAAAGALSSLIRHALSENERAYAQNPTARRAAESALAAIGFTADAFFVYGERRKNICALHLSQAAMHCDAASIKAALARALDAPMEDPLFEFADGGVRMLCSSRPRFDVSFDFAAAPAAGGEENGDSVRVFEGKDGYTYALISDGMGRGRIAAGKSRRAALFLEKMLAAGNSVRTAVELLSALLRREETEGFTTVDLVEIDRHLGRVCFFKSGAAPSFVRRGDRIFKIRSRTFPIGILEDVDAEKNSFAAQDGDIIVMVSDGIVGEYDEPLWLCELLSGGELAADNAAARIRRAAEAHAMCADDRSVCVLRINAAERGEDSDMQKDTESAADDPAAVK